jgi:hypothetical protein
VILDTIIIVPIENAPATTQKVIRCHKAREVISCAGGRSSSPQRPGRAVMN